MRLDLTKLENRLQALIEGSAARLFPVTTQYELVQRLLEIMMTAARQEGDARKICPNQYKITAHPFQAAQLRKQADLLDVLTQTVIDAARANDMDFLSPPVIQMIEDPGLPRQKVLVDAQFHLEHLAQTADIGDLSLDPEPVPENAFLIVDGMNTFCLKSSVVNIGRRPDNQLVIDDPRVSRLHAQLRAVHGNFMIFDLNTTGGTQVNGRRIRNCILSPGDVISLAGVPMVYGQDIAPSDPTQELVTRNPTPSGG